jgi:hypothetical protein
MDNLLIKNRWDLITTYGLRVLWYIILIWGVYHLGYGAGYASGVADGILNGSVSVKCPVCVTRTCPPAVPKECPDCPRIEERSCPAPATVATCQNITVNTGLDAYVDVNRTCNRCECKNHTVYEMPEATKKELLNLRWHNPGADCLQKGYGIGKTDCLAVLGLAGTYNGQPSYDTFQHYLQPLTQEGNTSQYCFARKSASDYNLVGMMQTHGFPLDHNSWGWTLINLTVSVDNWTEWVDADNHTWVKNTPYMSWNSTGDLWIQKLS